MLDRKIEDGTVFVVFDMEWNQPFTGKEYDFEVSELSGEIIEIGAVRYEYQNGTINRTGVFSCDIKPVKYKKLHFHVKKVTHKTNEDLKNGIDFKTAYEKFQKFCGPNAILAGWGNSDPDMLKMNLKFFGLDDELRMFFIDVQPVFSHFAGERGKQRSVEFAVDHYGIPKTDTFHNATADASYTGEVLKRIFDCSKTSEVLSVLSSSAIDPDIKREFSAVGAPCEKPEEALALLTPSERVCPICKASMFTEIKEFRIRKSVYALYNCEKHGDIFVRIRVKKNKSGHYYASSIERIATQNDYFLVASKREEYSKFGSKGEPKVDNMEEL
ncbi:MAG: exonuclease domain-containing protein [Clostridiales bacterium]|nr:exonuclease domain-containing protein [Clostridiales bacterium]